MHKVVGPDIKQERTSLGNIVKEGNTSAHTHVKPQWQLQKLLDCNDCLKSLSLNIKGIIIFVQAHLISMCFNDSFEPQFKSNVCFQILINYYFCLFQVISMSMVGFVYIYICKRIVFAVIGWPQDGTTLLFITCDLNDMIICLQLLSSPFETSNCFPVTEVLWL